ncbi:MAG TPA: transporter substrate-binding domain-containing protein, partial [Methylomirabilota bacterium]|nr:transporter substrate-binding domain-containing protein [Methylomirabilota bacterium]
EVRARGTLRVVAVLDPKRPEFFATKPELPPGFDHEILQGFADLHRLQLQIVPAASWDELLPTLLAGKADVIGGRFTATEMRRKSIDFTSEVFPYRLVVMTRKPGPVVATLDDLRRQKVGTMKGTNMAETIATLGLPPENVDDAIPTGGFVEALRSGRVTAVLWGVESAIASQKDDPAIQLGTFVGAPGSLAFGVRKNDPGLLAALNAYVDNFRRSPAWSRLVVKYFGADAPAILKKARGE